MKFLKAALVATAIAGFSTSAMAQDSGAYINVGVDTLEFDLYNLGGKLGYNFNQNFGVEAQGSFGITKDDGLKNDYTLGAFLVARTAVSEQFDVFVRGGYYTAEFSAFGDSATTDSFAVGGGLQYNIDAANGIRVEYTLLDGEGGGSADGFGVSYVRKF